MDTRDEYITKDLREATFLIAAGSPFPRLDNFGKIFRFCFDDSDGATGWLAQEWGIDDPDEENCPVSGSDQATSLLTHRTLSKRVQIRWAKVGKAVGSQEEQEIIRRIHVR